MTPNDSKMTPNDSKMDFRNESKMNPNDSKMTPNDSKMDFRNESKMNPKWIHFDSIESKMNPNESKIIESTNSLKYICTFCNKHYSTNSNLHKHLKNCKNKKISTEKIKELEEKNTKLQETVEKLLEKTQNIGSMTTNNTNNNNNCNNTNNSVHIHINNYGEEDTKYITKQYILNLLQKPYTAIPELIKHIHFNEEHPENQNIKITNKKEPYVKILKDNKWELQNKKDTINDLIDKQHSTLNESKIQKKMDKYLDEDDKDRIEQFNDKYKKDDKDLMNKLYKESEMMIMNKS
jgi:hypothetical protein